MAPTCLACDLIQNPSKLPGGRIYETVNWVVEPCIGPLGLGTLIVKPKRHCLAVADLTKEEAAELGPLLRRASAVVSALTHPDQVYVCLWSHAQWQPVHIHFVVQPVSGEQRADHDKPGPFLQAGMLEKNHHAPEPEVKALMQKAAALFEQLRD